MSEDGGFSIDQLMELAGLSVSQAGMRLGRYGLVCRANAFHIMQSSKSIHRLLAQPS